MDVGAAGASRRIPGVYVPNEGTDPERAGLSLADAGRARREAGEIEALRWMELRVVERQLVTEESAPLLDGERLARELVSMVP